MPTTPVAPSAVPDFPALSDRTTYNAKAYAWAVHMDTVYPAEMQALATVTQSNAVEAAASAVTASGYVATVAASAVAAAASVTQASDQAAIAQGADNNKGNWSALTGPLNTPAAVVHASKIWVLRTNLADVTASTPGANADWLDMSSGGAESPYACNLSQVVVPLAVSGSHAVASVVTVDASRTLILTRASAGTHAVVYDKTTGLCGTAVLVRSGANHYPQGILCGTDKVLVCSCPATTALQTVVLSLSGTTVTVGTPVSTTLSETGYIAEAPIAVGSSYVFSLTSATNARAFAVTVSGTTPTVGEAVNSHASTDNQRIRVIDSTRFLLVSRDTGTLNYATPYTVSGSTLTKGTSATWTGSFVLTVVGLASGRFAVVYTNTATWGAIVTVPSTTASVTTVQLGTGASVNGGGTKVGANQLIVGASATEANVLTDVGGTATAGTAVTVFIASNLSSSIGYGADYVSFAIDSAGMMLLATVKISGNNPVIYSSADTRVPVLVGGSVGAMYTGAPADVLSITGKSIKVIPPGTSTATYAVECGTGYKTRMLHPVVNSYAKESDAVIWAGYGNTPASAITLNRLELV